MLLDVNMTNKILEPEKFLQKLESLVESSREHVTIEYDQELSNELETNFCFYVRPKFLHVFRRFAWGGLFAMHNAAKRIQMICIYIKRKSQFTWNRYSTNEYSQEELLYLIGFVVILNERVPNLVSADALTTFLHDIKMDHEIIDMFKKKSTSVWRDAPLPQQFAWADKRMRS